MISCIELKYFKSFSFLVILVTICFACVKEEDMITETQTVISNQVGETKLVNGIVRDTSGFRIPEASVKIILENLELETVTDINGEWIISIPSRFSEGFIVANKFEYTKTIQRYLGSANNNEIYLLEDVGNANIDLSVRLDSVKIVTGRIINQNAEPLPNISLLILSKFDSEFSEVIFSVFQTTNQDGSFELVFEDHRFESNTLIATNNNGCHDSIEYPLSNEAFVEDLGNLELPIEILSVFEASILSDGSNCYDNIATLSYSLGSLSQLVSINYDQPLGDITLEYCSKEQGAFYVGVENEDNSEFNGAFFTEQEFQASYAFDICTPNDNNFLELTINGNTTVYEENLSYDGFTSIQGIVNLQDSETQLEMQIDNSITAFSSNPDQPSYQIGTLSVLSIQGSVEYDFTFLDVDAPKFKHANIVVDDNNTFAGIAQAKVLEEDGSETEIKIRFRISK